MERKNGNTSWDDNEVRWQCQLSIIQPRWEIHCYSIRRLYRKNNRIYPITRAIGQVQQTIRRLATHRRGAKGVQLQITPSIETILEQCGPARACIDYKYPYTNLHLCIFN